MRLIFVGQGNPRKLFNLKHFPIYGILYGISVQLRILIPYSYDLPVWFLIVNFVFNKEILILKWLSTGTKMIYSSTSYFSISYLFSNYQLYDILHYRNSVSFTDYFHPPDLLLLPFELFSSSINSYHYSNFLFIVLFA